MALLQLYEDDKEMRLFEEHYCVTFTRTDPMRSVGFCRSAATQILSRMGYDRTTAWEQTTWGCEAEFERRRDAVED